MYSSQCNQPFPKLEVKLHQMMPSILTCLLSSSLPTPNEPPTALDIRKHAASLLGEIMSRFAGAYPTLRPRVMKTLLRGLLDEETSSALGTKYGAVIGLYTLGREVVRRSFGYEANLKAVDGLLSKHAESVEGRECIKTIMVSCSLPWSVALANCPPLNRQDCNKSTR